MAVDVHQAFLHDPVEGDYVRRLQSWDGGRQIEEDRDSGANGELAGILLNSGKKSALLEPRSMEVVSQRTKLVGAMFRQGLAIDKNLAHIPILMPEHLARPVDIQLHGDKILDSAIV